MYAIIINNKNKLYFTIGNKVCIIDLFIYNKITITNYI